MILKVPSWIRLLYFLKMNQGVQTLKGISERFDGNLCYPRFSLILSQLERDGFVKKSMCGRERIIQLTKKGFAVAELYIIIHKKAPQQSEADGSQ